MTSKRLEELLAREQPKIRNRFRQIVQRARDSKTVAQLETALESGRAGEVVSAWEKALEGLSDQTEASYETVARAVAQSISKRLDKVVSFDTANARAVDAVRSNGLRMVRELTEKQRAAFVEALAEGTRLGLNPRDQAKVLRDTLGLTASQARWVASYRARLRNLDPAALGMALRDKRYDATTLKAIAEKKPLTEAQIDKMTARYYERAVKYRSEVIARTETLRAAHEAQDEAYRQAVDAGHIDEDQVQQSWKARMVNTRHSHAAMNGQKRRMGVPFTSGNGYELRYPGDHNAPAEETVQCVCVKTTRILPPGQVAVNSGTPPPPAAPTTAPVAAPKPPPPPPSTESLLTGGTVSARAPLGGGVNDTEILTLEMRGTQAQAVWKPVDGEMTIPGSPVKRGTYYRREAASSAVADQLGVGDMVPRTVVRVIDAQRGSLQSFVADASKNPGAVFDEDGVQRMRVFDFVTGNSDRHRGNVLWRTTDAGASRPVLIDNGLAFPPRAPDLILTPEYYGRRMPLGPLSDEIVETIAKIDERKLAKKLRAAKIEDAAIKETLYRVRVLKRDPQLLELRQDDEEYEDDNRWQRAMRGARAAMSAQDRAEIDAILRDLR